MGTILVKGAITRKPGYLYYKFLNSRVEIGNVDGKGNSYCNSDEPETCVKLKWHVAEERKKSNLS